MPGHSPKPLQCPSTVEEEKEREMKSASILHFYSVDRNCNAVTLKEGRIHLERVLAQEQMSDHNNLDALKIAYKLGDMYRHEGMLEHAESMFKRVVDGREIRLGSDHFLTLSARRALGLTYAERGKGVEALDVLTNVHDTELKTSGHNNPATLRTARYIAILQADQEKVDMAEVQLRKVLEMQEICLGRQHEETLRTSIDLAGILTLMMRYQEAADLYSRALVGLQTGLGPDHLDTLFTKECLGHVKLALHQSNAAKELFQQAVDGYKRRLGLGHPKTQRAMRDFAASEPSLSWYRPSNSYHLPNTYPCLRPEQSRSHSQTLRAMEHLYLLEQHHRDGRSKAKKIRLLDEVHEDGRSLSNTADSGAGNSYSTKDKKEVELDVGAESEWVKVPSDSPSNDHDRGLEFEGEAEAESKDSPFDRRIRIEGAEGKLVQAIALLDTQCRVGNWISNRLVKRLHKEGDISQNYTPPRTQDVNGQAVISCGTITLEWMFHPNKVKIHECDFHVFVDSAHLDVVIGRQYIADECLLEAPKEVLAVLTEHERQPTDADKAKTAARQEEQRRRKAALEARRQQQGNNQSGSSQSTAAAAPRSQQQQADK